MKKITVNLSERSYDIIIGYKIIDSLGSMLQKLNIGSDAIIISNPTVHHLHGGHIYSALRRSGLTVKFYIVPDTERSKSQKACFEIINKIAAYDDKKSIFIIAFGGGVIGDLAGFIASIYKRGIPYVQAPTTLLAQVDSAIGGKTAIDLDIGKNLVGSFYQPRLVVSDISFLRSLSMKQIRGALAEAIKCGVVKDARFFNYIKKNYKDIMNLHIESLSKVIYACSKIKAALVEADETDKTGKRAILNFGHTIGHAIEAASGYTKEYSHGEAVSIGMACACDIARRLRLLNAASARAVEDLLVKVGLPVRCSYLRLEDIMQAQYRDKKFIYGKNRFVLPVKIGKAIVKKDIPIRIIEDIVKKRIKNG